jgi:hypothetical protein
VTTYYVYRRAYGAVEFLETLLADTWQEAEEYAGRRWATTWSSEIFLRLRPLEGV